MKRTHAETTPRKTVPGTVFISAPPRRNREKTVPGTVFVSTSPRRKWCLAAVLGIAACWLIGGCQVDQDKEVAVYRKVIDLPATAPTTQQAIDTLIEHASRLTSPKSYCIVFQLGGALGRVGADETAFSQRDATHNVNINAVWTGDDPERGRHVAWARDFFSAMQPHAGGRVYVNFLGDEGAERVRQAYGDAQYERLVKLKRAYDPTNFFRMNQNIEP